MPIRLSGLASGLDTESIIKELMSAQNMKVTKVENKKTKLEWKEEKWKDLNKKIYALYTGELSKLKLQSSYVTKKAESSNSSKVTVTAGTNVPSGTHTVQVEKVASSQCVTGTEVKKADGSADKVSSNSLLSELGIKSGSTFTVKGSKAPDGSTFVVQASTKISDLTKWARDAGVSLSFDEQNQKFFASSRECGLDNAFTMTSTLVTDDYSANNQAIFEASGYKMLKDDQKAEIDQALLTISNATATVDQYNAAKKTIEDYAQAFKATKDTLGEVKNSEEFQQKFQENIVKAKNAQGISALTQDERDALTTQIAYVRDNAQNMTDSALAKMGLCELKSKEASAYKDSAVKFIEASNCVINYNGERYERAVNEVTINGLKINALAETGNEEVKISVNGSTEDAYKMVKDFVTSYNSILKEVNDLYYAGSAKGYDVLSSEEKEAMTDDQVEKWEKKIKDSLLRRDNTLGSIRTALTSVTSMKVGKSQYTLSQLGIGTSAYTEKGILHINGNKDDSMVSSQEDLLMKALESDPDMVMETLTGVGNELYGSLSKLMSATSLSSALTLYNDKQITTQKKSYDSEIKRLQDKLSTMESKYYSKFAAMEKAMSKMDASSSYFASMFGQ